MSKFVKTIIMERKRLKNNTDVLIDAFDLNQKYGGELLEKWLNSSGE